MPRVVVVGFLGERFRLSPASWLPALAALAVRIITRLPGQSLARSIAHVAAFRELEGGGWEEIEAVVPCIRRVPFLSDLPGNAERAVESYEIHDPTGAGWDWARAQIGRRYGYEAAALTGLATLPGWRGLSAGAWAYLRAGRTAPLHCALLCRGIEQRATGIQELNAAPISPNELMALHLNSL